jgi:hypothetical protein
MGQHMDKGKGKEMGKGKGLCKGEDVGKGKGKMKGQATPAPPQPHACSTVSCLVRLRQKSLRHCLRSGPLRRSLSDRPGRLLIAPGDQATVRLWLACAFASGLQKHRPAAQPPEVLQRTANCSAKCGPSKVASCTIALKSA